MNPMPKNGAELTGWIGILRRIFLEILQNVNYVVFSYISAASVFSDGGLLLLPRQSSHYDIKTPIFQPDVCESRRSPSCKSSLYWYVSDPEYRQAEQDPCEFYNMFSRTNAANLVTSRTYFSTVALDFSSCSKYFRNSVIFSFISISSFLSWQYNTFELWHQKIADPFFKDLRFLSYRKWNETRRLCCSSLFIYNPNPTGKQFCPRFIWKLRRFPWWWQQPRKQPQV